VASPKLPLPKYRAQRATVVEQAPSGEQWVHELKYDGYRLGSSIAHGEVRLADSRGRDWTAQFPELVAELKRLPVRDALLDGELAIVLPNGTTSRRALENALAGAPRVGLTYFVFDLLHLDGQDLAALPLEQRKLECEKLLAGVEGTLMLRFSRHFASDGPTLLERACELGAEGIVSKRRDQPYRAGRSKDWLESNCVDRQNQANRSAKRATAAASGNAATVRGITITSPERTVYPELGFNKLELSQLYGDIADWMLPYISNRPLTLVRCDKGVRSRDALRSECKFLRHEPGWHRWVTHPIRRIQIQELKKVGEYLVVDSPAGLVSLAQGDILEIHVWNATTEALEQPDRLVFDLDPGERVEWQKVLEAARLLRDELAAAGLESWPKLTGGQGIHVVAPLRPERPWDEVYAFSRRIADSVVAHDPGSLTVDFARAGRARKILIDYKRNHRAAVAVAAFSARARPNGAMSVPVSWRELTPALTPDRWTVRNLRDRLGRLKSDPWKGFWQNRQRLRG
jgi:DNA ligase D-like protein (predicted polymerase)